MLLCKVCGRVRVLFFGIYVFFDVLIICCIIFDGKKLVLIKLNVLEMENDF